MTYDLPKSLMVCGREYEVRSDFRAVLGIMEILNDVELTEQERCYLVLLFFYIDFENMPVDSYQEAVRECFWFINGGKYEDASKKKQPRLMDWEQDFPYIIAPINRVIGHEIRGDAYLHWWTFLAAYMEIGECTFSQIVHVRDMKSRGKQLDKTEQEWYRRNRELVDLKTRYTSAEEDILKKWGGGVNV